MTSIAKVLIALGLILAATGGLMWVLARLGLPLGRLPGDLRFHYGDVSVVIPLATSIVLSLILTVIINIALRLRR